MLIPVLRFASQLLQVRNCFIMVRIIITIQEDHGNEECPKSYDYLLCNNRNPGVFMKR